MKAVLYLRVSTTKQAWQGSGHKHQLSICTSTAKQLGYEIIMVYYDEGISGATPLEERAVLQTALESLEPGDVLIVSRINRLARSSYFSLKISNAVKARGARIVSALEPECNDEDNQVARFKAAIKAEYERELYIQATQKSAELKKQENRCVGTIKYGFQRSSDLLSIEPNAQEQAVIELVKELHSFGYNTTQITQHVNTQGFRSRNKTQFQAAQINTIIKKHCAKSDIYEPAKKLSTVPYGYAYNLDTFKIEPFACEQEIIARARMLKQHGFSYRYIASSLNATGFRNRRGNYFNKNQIAKMFIVRSNEGLRTELICTKKLTSKTKILQAKKQAVYKAALQLRQEGYSYPAIAQELHSKGYKSRNKKQLSVSSIYYLLKSTPPVTLKKTAGKSTIAYGFTYDKTSLEIIPCTQEQEVITLVTALHAKGYKNSQIIKQLEHYGYKTRCNKSFKHTQIDRILKKRHARYTT